MSNAASFGDWSWFPISSHSVALTIIYTVDMRIYCMYVIYIVMGMGGTERKVAIKYSIHF